MLQMLTIFFFLFSAAAKAEFKSMTTVSCRTINGSLDHRYKDYSLVLNKENMHCHLTITNEKTKKIAYEYQGDCLYETDNFYWKGIELDMTAWFVDAPSLKIVFFPFDKITKQMDRGHAKGAVNALLRLSRPQLTLDDLACDYSYKMNNSFYR